MANTTPELIPCPACTRHVRARDTVCPHCGWTLAAPLRPPPQGGASSEPATMYGPPPVPDRARIDTHPIAPMYGPPVWRDPPRPVLSNPFAIVLAAGALLLLVLWWVTR